VYSAPHSNSLHGEPPPCRSRLEGHPNFYRRREVALEGDAAPALVYLLYDTELHEGVLRQPAKYARVPEGDWRSYLGVSYKEDDIQQRADEPTPGDGTVQQLMNSFGFPEERARDALDALGPDAEVDAAVNWLLDNGEEDRGGAITLKCCPHAATTTLIKVGCVSVGQPCCESGCTGRETWQCLVCGETRCGRYCKRHSLEHWEKTAGASEGAGHHLALSSGDCSVWCYVCSAYINNRCVASHVRRLQELKFGGGSGLDAVAEAAEAEEEEAFEEEVVPPTAASPPMAFEADWLARRWEQQLALRADPIAQPTTSTALRGARESSMRVDSSVHLNTPIHKGVEGSLTLLVEGSDDEFVFARPSHQPASCKLHEWLHHARIDLAHRLPRAQLPWFARKAIDDQLAVLERCLTLALPFSVRVTDPRAESHIGTPPANGPPPPLPCRDLAAFASRLATATNVIVMVGAGASVSAGIPDFRSPGTGLYDNLQKYNLPRPEAIFDISFFRQNPAPFYQLCAELWPGTYAPTSAHRFIRMLHDEGKLLRCYTQNIDSLESAAGVPRDKIVAAHGNFDSARVVGGGSVPIEELRTAVMAGPDGTAEINAKYGGLCKPDITFFGEALPRRFGQLAPADFEVCDLLVVMGTSLQVQPFASLTNFPEPGTPRLLINRELPPGCGFDLESKVSSDVFYQGDCDDGVAELASLAGLML